MYFFCSRQSGEEPWNGTTQSWVPASVWLSNVQLPCMFALDSISKYVGKEHQQPKPSWVKTSLLEFRVTSQEPPSTNSHGMEGSQPTLFGAERHASLRWWPGQQRPSCGNQQPAWPNSGWWSPLNWCYQGEALHLAVGKCEHTCQWGMDWCRLAKWLKVYYNW